MFDLRMVTAIDTLPVTSVDLESMFPLVMLLHGVHFDYAVQVAVNNLLVSKAAQNFDQNEPGYNELTGSFQVLASDTIRLVCPKQLWSQPVERVNVLGEAQTQLDKSTQITFEFKNFRQVTGVTKIMQHLCKLLKTTPGTNFFSPADGGGIHQFVGMTLDKTNVQGFVSKLHQAIRKCVDAIKDSQKDRLWKLPADEILVDAIPVDVLYDPNALAISIILEIQTAAHQAIVKIGV